MLIYRKNVAKNRKADGIRTVNQIGEQRFHSMKTAFQRIFYSRKVYRLKMHPHLFKCIHQ